MRRTVLPLVLLVAACQGNCERAPDFARMIEQPRADAYEATPFFPDGKVMRPLVAGTVSRSRVLGPPELTTGLSGGAYVTRFPLAVTRELVQRGGTRFDIHCAACHGLLGDGVSQVAENMRLRRPPSLHELPYRDYPPGRLYAVITGGWGLMRPYANELDLRDRWAVVAYVQALQLSQSMTVERLTPELRQEAQAWLR